MGLEWREQALCARHDPEIFFPAKGESTRKAKAICEMCLVRVECLNEAVKGRIRYGVWGGRSERERRRASPVR